MLRRRREPSGQGLGNQGDRKKGRLEGGPEFWEETPIGAQALTRQGRDNALHNIEAQRKISSQNFRLG
jgi:hypothetical protein